jgi:signal recognition particle GTPase
VLLGACDTFRAAAVEQLGEWARRANVSIEVPTAEERGGDPVPVVRRSIRRAVAEKFDFVIIDTSGRLSNNFELIEQLQNMKAAIQKELPQVIIYIYIYIYIYIFIYIEREVVLAIKLLCCIHRFIVVQMVLSLSPNTTQRTFTVLTSLYMWIPICYCLLTLLLQAPHETLLVVDGSVGRNAVDQANAWRKYVGVSGLVITKLDGTARG